jgi:hypothetical protein
MILAFLPIAQFRLVRAPLSVGVCLLPTLTSGADMKRGGALRVAKVGGVT